MNNLNKVKISACIITYNQEQYIEQCIQGALKQTVDQYEILISDDCSSDKTSEICRYYQNKHPDLIRYVKHKKNLGVIDNWVYALNNVKGKYIAVCEGDDYWLDPCKLQKQVGFLESNPDFELCFTNCETVDKNNTTLNPSFLNNSKSIFTKEDLLFIAPTLTRVFRNRNFNKIDFKAILALDAYLLIWQLQKGKAKYFSEITSAYRKHEKGIWSLVDGINKVLYYFEIRLKAFNIIEKKLFPKFYRLTVVALLNIAVLDKIVYKESLEKFKEVYKNHDLNSFYIKRLLLCYKLIEFSNNSNKKFIKKMILKII